MRLLSVALLLFSLNAGANLPKHLPDGDYRAVKIRYNMALPKNRASDLRDDAFRRAKVWVAPAAPIEKVNFLQPEVGYGAFQPEEEIFCKWAVEEKFGGETPKFYCTRPSGDLLKIKYAKAGKYNPEIPNEIISSRLLRTLGFGADRMYMVRKVRCFGCPSDPVSYSKQMHSPFENIRKGFYERYGEYENGQYVYEPDYDKYTDFEYVAVERRQDGHRIEAKDDQGWDVTKLNEISGATRAEIEAAQLLMSFLQLADNKDPNQVLICLDNPARGDGHCETPLAAFNDLGVSLGSGHSSLGGYSKFDAEEWASTSVWAEGGRCSVKVTSSPAGHLMEARISNDGRLFLSDLLGRLSDQQIRDLFNYAQVANYRGGPGANRNVEYWLKAFKAKRSAIAERTCGHE